mmetsp:Transcript_6642/g.16505  ORF Transcript_6642/g.16505 Transcript_6642/m.16505 type:complete len:515 (-) Transcript_6642:145-1689(-)
MPGWCAGQVTTTRHTTHDMRRGGAGGPPPPATASVDQAAARELVAWLTVEKGMANGAANSVSFGDGAVATLLADVRAGEPLIAIPQNLTVTSVDVADSPIVAGLAAGRGELVGLALWLCHERAKGRLSEWAPYIATLPNAGPDHPLMWPTEDITTFLKGSPAVAQALSRAADAAEEYASIRDAIRGDPANFPADVYDFLSEPAFTDALATVLARAVWLNAANCYAMVPLVDLLPVVGAPAPGVNPALAGGGPGARKSGLASAAGVVDYDAATECVTVVCANDSQQTASVICVDPLARNSGDLFLCTGVVDPDHCGDYLTFTASTVNTDRLYQAKKQILEAMDMSADGQDFPVFADRMPLQLLAYMRFARVQEPSELMTVSFEEDRIVSPMNEYEILQLLMGDTREKLGEYESSTEEYELLQLKEKGLSSRARTAAQLILGEKRVINATTTAVRRRLAPIRGIPTKKGLEDPNADLLEIFDTIENLPNKPKEMFENFRAWARGDFEDDLKPKGKL